MAIFMAARPADPARKIFTTLRQDLSPVIAAVSTLLVALDLSLMVLAAFFRKGDAP